MRTRKPRSKCINDSAFSVQQDMVEWQMGSTARRRGVCGGEYAPTGLRLFAWWKKNKKGGFRNWAAAPHKLGDPNRRPQGSFYSWCDLTNGLGQNQYAECTSRQTIATHPGLPRARRPGEIDPIDLPISPCACAVAVWPGGPCKAQLGLATASERARGSRSPWLLDRASSARCLIKRGTALAASSFFFFIFSLYLFFSNK
jgi:hypothetical protein